MPQKSIERYKKKNRS